MCISLVQPLSIDRVRQNNSFRPREEKMQKKKNWCRCRWFWRWCAFRKNSHKSMWMKRKRSTVCYVYFSFICFGIWLSLCRCLRALSLHSLLHFRFCPYFRIIIWARQTRRVAYFGYIFFERAKILSFPVFCAFSFNSPFRYFYLSLLFVEWILIFQFFFSHFVFLHSGFEFMPLIFSHIYPLNMNYKINAINLQCCWHKTLQHSHIQTKTKLHTESQ